MTSFFVKEGQEALEEISKQDPSKLAVIVLQGQGLSDLEESNKILATEKISKALSELDEILYQFRDLQTRKTYSKSYINNLLTKGSLILNDKSLMRSISLLKDTKSEISIYKQLLDTAKGLRNVQSLEGLDGLLTSPSFEPLIIRVSSKLSQASQKELKEKLDKELANLKHRW